MQDVDAEIRAPANVHNPHRAIAARRSHYRFEVRFGNVGERSRHVWRRRFIDLQYQKKSTDGEQSCRLHFKLSARSGSITTLTMSVFSVTSYPGRCGTPTGIIMMSP